MPTRQAGKKARSWPSSAPFRPERLWASITMDYISGFLKVNDISSVMVMVAHCTKYVIFIPVPTMCFVDKAAKLLLMYDVKHFGVTEDIVNDQNACFTERL